jgi:hypothetical protein
MRSSIVSAFRAVGIATALAGCTETVVVPAPVLVRAEAVHAVFDYRGLQAQIRVPDTVFIGEPFRMDFATPGDQCRRPSLQGTQFDTRWANDTMYIDGRVADSLYTYESGIAACGSPRLYERSGFSQTRTAAYAAIAITMVATRERDGGPARVSKLVSVKGRGQ